MSKLRLDVIVVDYEANKVFEANWMSGNGRALQHGRVNAGLAGQIRLGANDRQECPPRLHLSFETVDSCIRGCWL